MKLNLRDPFDLAQRIVAFAGDNQPHKPLRARQCFAVTGQRQEDWTSGWRFGLAALNARAKAIGADHVGMAPSRDTISVAESAQCYPFKAKGARSAVACADNITIGCAL